MYPVNRWGVESGRGGQGEHQMPKIFLLVLPLYRCAHLGNSFDHCTLRFLICILGVLSLSVQNSMLLYERGIKKNFNYKGKNFPRLKRISGG